MWIQFLHASVHTNFYLFCQLFFYLLGLLILTVFLFPAEELLASQARLKLSLDDDSHCEWSHLSSKHVLMTQDFIASIIYLAHDLIWLVHNTSCVLFNIFLDCSYLYMLNKSYLRKMDSCGIKVRKRVQSASGHKCAR